jgi:hypothetical protein
MVAKRSLRGIAVTRKNFLFPGSETYRAEGLPVALPREHPIDRFAELPP